MRGLRKLFVEKKNDEADRSEKNRALGRPQAGAHELSSRARRRFFRNAHAEHLEREYFRSNSGGIMGCRVDVLGRQACFDRKSV